MCRALRVYLTRGQFGPAESAEKLYRLVERLRLPCLFLGVFASSNFLCVPLRSSVWLGGSINQGPRPHGSHDQFDQEIEYEPCPEKSQAFETKAVKFVEHFRGDECRNETQDSPRIDGVCAQGAEQIDHKIILLFIEEKFRLNITTITAERSSDLLIVEGSGPSAAGEGMSRGIATMFAEVFTLRIALPGSTERRLQEDSENSLANKPELFLVILHGSVPAIPCPASPAQHGGADGPRSAKNCLATAEVAAATKGGFTADGADSTDCFLFHWTLSVGRSRAKPALFPWISSSTTTAARSYANPNTRNTSRF